MRWTSVKYALPASLRLYCRRCDKQHWFRLSKGGQYVSLYPALPVVEAPEGLPLARLGRDVRVDGCGHRIHPMNVLVTYACDNYDGTVSLPRHLTKEVEA